MKEKIAFVCQRYGLEVNGGAELLCRQLAEKLKGIYDVEVYTTCAMDYVTWDNHYKEGIEMLNGVTVRRYATSVSRNQKQFVHISEKVYTNPNHTDAEELEWIEKQGPVCQKLLNDIANKHKDYKAVLFMTYLYYLSAKGLPMNLPNAILIPTLHDEPPIYLRYYDKVFEAAKGFIWQTPEELEFAERRFPQIKGKPGVIGGAGVDVPDTELPELPDSLKGQRYIVYAGRIDESKGCKELFEYFERYKQTHRNDVKLVLMGKTVMDIPKSRDVIYLGFATDEMKLSVIRSAIALVLFSKFESLSIVVLESMTMGRPVLVNGQCEVLKGHCIRSNAGLCFEDYPEFAAMLNWLLEHDAEYEVMRENGKRYVEVNYQWNVIIDKISGMIDRVCAL